MHCPTRLQTFALCMVFAIGGSALSHLALAQSPKKPANRAATKPKTTKTNAKSTPQPTRKPPPARQINPNAGKTAFNPQTVKHRALLTGTEERVNSLKERIFRSKAQLMLLQEKLLHGVISTAKLRLIHDNRMGGSFYLKRAAYSIDGRPVYSSSDKNGSLNNKKSFTVFNESVSPGPHRITVSMRYVGNGFGIFSYLRQYKFNIRSSYPFRAQEGKIMEIKVVPYQKGWTVPLQKRAALKYEVKIRKLYGKKKKKQ